MFPLFPLLPTAHQAQRRRHRDEFGHPVHGDDRLRHRGASRRPGRSLLPGARGSYISALGREGGASASHQ